MGTALPWTWLSGWALEQSSADASWHHQIWYWHSGNTQPWDWIFLVSAISNINLPPYFKFKAKDKTKCKPALILPLSSKLNSDRGCTNRIPHSSKESYTLLKGSAGKHFTWVFYLTNCCHTMKSLLVVNEVQPLQTELQYQASSHSIRFPISSSILSYCQKLHKGIQGQIWFCATCSSGKLAWYMEVEEFWGCPALH